VAGSPVQFKDRFDTAFEGVVSNAVFLIFATAKFTFDLHVCAFLQARGKVSKFPSLESRRNPTARLWINTISELVRSMRMRVIDS
jgi:hypothetical protein